MDSWPAWLSSCRLARLDNAGGTGWLPKLLAAETETLDQAATLLARNPAREQLAASERSAADRALQLLRTIR